MATNIYGTNGDDFLWDMYGEDNFIYGYDGNDTVYANGGDDWIRAGHGYNFIDGGWGFDTVDYSDYAPLSPDPNSFGVGVQLANGLEFGRAVAYGIDTIRSIDQVIGSEFWDSIQGNDDFNVLWGMGGRDFLFGMGGADWLYGGANDDWLLGEADGDYLNGGAGNDWASYGDATAGVIASLIDGGSGGDAAGDVYVDIEHLWGSDYADVLRGDDNYNALYGNGGNDRLEGRGGTDVLDASLGNDTLDGGTGNDEMRGGPGDDDYIVDSAGDLVGEQVGEGHDTVSTSVNYVLRPLTEVEVLQTINQKATAPIDLVGNEFDNTIIGNEGHNTLAGSRAGDDVDGDGIEDYDGLDHLIGNGGSDSFVWNGTAESGVAGREADAVQDFTPGSDFLIVSPIDANETIAGNQAFTFVGTAAFSAPGQIRYFNADTDGDGVNDQTYVLLNTDADLSQEMTIRLVGVYTVEASWFDL